MYNRYVPQPDGSFRRNQIPTAPQQKRRPQTSAPSPVSCPAECEEDHISQLPCPAQQERSAGDFLRRLLPKNLDTGDLLIIVLLLLMSADCEDEKNSAWLTLALYLFM